MIVVVLFPVNIICSIIAAKLAETKGKDIFKWVLLALFLGLIAIAILAFSEGEYRRSRGSLDLRKVNEHITNKKPICMKCGNTLTKGAVCDMCGYVNTVSSSAQPTASSPKAIPKVPKYKCKGCEETIDTVQCPWCGRKQQE